jgi:hypothetical protein
MNKLKSFYANRGNILKSVFIILIFSVLMLIIYRLVLKKLTQKSDSVWIIEQNKNAKHSVVITQDPNNDNSITLYRSDNEENGIEFTYSLWFLIESMDYKFGEWKHIFHKGNKSTYPNRAPGVFLHETENTVRVYMNTMNDVLEHVDIKNIPLKRWVHMGLVINGMHMDIYINGKLRTRHKLSSLPRQNFGDLWINLFGGFDGFVSKLKYYRRALDYTEIEEIIREGPSKKLLFDVQELPPYLEDNWWFSH